MAMQNGNFGRLKTLKSFPKYFCLRLGIPRMSLTQRLLPSDHKSVDASLQDQQMINTFARLHMVYVELAEQRKVLKKRLDDIESASVAL